MRKRETELRKARKKIIITNALVKKADKLPAREKKKSEESMKDYTSREKTGEYYG